MSTQLHRKQDAQRSSLSGGARQADGAVIRPAPAKPKDPHVHVLTPVPAKVRQFDNEQSAVAEVERLWTVKDVSRFLQRSVRWTQAHLAYSEDEPGSIPHVRLPTRGSRRQVRFEPEVLRAWVRLGCPAAADFRKRRLADS